MAVSDDYLEYVLDQLSGVEGVMPRRMFGGIGLFSGNVMFGLIAGDMAYLKVDEDNREEYVSRDLKPFRPWPDRPVVMPYYEIPPDVLEDPVELAEWAARSIAAALRQKD